MGRTVRSLIMNTKTNNTNGTSTKKTNVRDAKAPKYLKVIIQDQDGNELTTMIAVAKEFKTGSVGYYAGDKMANPNNPECRYQVGMNFTLIGSKPE